MYKTIICLLFAINVSANTNPSWNSFNDSVFIKARAQKKPVLLHLRANWCHWCHVMEEKTYTDNTVIAYLNKNFIACSEDHDERIDLTSRYADYGWPATIIFDADGNELFKQAGYIPADEFMTILKNVVAKKTKAIAGNNAAVQTAGTDEQHKSLQKLKLLFDGSIDTNSGGFGFGQKYIDFETYEFALNHYQQEPVLRSWLKKTTDNSSGINDAVWGGVYQYSTHNDWEHVHYEKLLAVQARYMKAYCWYYLTFNDTTALNKALSIAGYVDRFLRSPEGMYYNSQDADLIKGEKASEYFALNDKDRLAKGIPAVDSNIYTNENALLMESFVVLWSASGKEIYLEQAKTIADYLLANRRRADGGFIHGNKPQANISLNDNLYTAKALLMLHRATANNEYKNVAIQTARFIQHTFYSGNSFFYSYVGKSALAPTYNISENIELARVFNLLSFVSEDSSLRKTAANVLGFLLSETVVKKMYTEPGLISAHEESKKEPLSGSYFQLGNKATESSVVRELVAVPLFYIQSGVYSNKTVPADKKDLYESISNNTVFFCTSSYCSSPMYTAPEVRSFIRKSIIKQ